MSQITIKGFAGMTNVNLNATGDARHVDISAPDGGIKLTIDGPLGNRSIDGFVGKENVSLTHQGSRLFGGFGANQVSVQEFGSSNLESYSGDMGRGTVSGNTNGPVVSGFFGANEVSATSSGVIPDLDVLDYLVAFSPSLSKNSMLLAHG